MIISLEDSIGVKYKTKMSKYVIIHCYGTTDRYYVEPSNEQKCLFEGTYEECERFIEKLNQNKDE
jgi:hypothetical protein